MASKTKTEQVKVLSHMAKARRKKNACSGLKCDRNSLVKYEEYFSSMFSSSRYKGEAVHWDVRAMAADQDVSPPFTVEDVCNVLKALPRGKAPGRSGLRGELFSSIAQTLAQHVHELFAAVWNSGHCPQSWTVACIFPLHKKGAKAEISNYRPISLTETLRKAFERTVYPALLKVVEPLDICQGGFRRQRGTLEQVACLHDAIITRGTALHGPRHLAFLDIKAAYGSVHRPLL
jgi:hypothetical protein